MRLGERSWHWRGLLGVVAAVVVVFVGSRIPLPGFDDFAVQQLRRQSQWLPPASTSVLALGILPATSAYLLVELIAVLLPRLRAARHQAKVRKRLTRAARLLTVALAALQAASVAMYASSIELLQGSPWLVVVTLTGGACALLLLAEAITRHGLVNGFVLLLALDGLLRVGQLNASTAELSPGVAVALGGAAVLLIVALTALCAGVVVPVSCSPRGGASARPYRSTTPDTELLGLAAPPSGVFPLTAAPALFIALGSLTLPAGLLGRLDTPLGRVGVTLAISIAMGYLLSSVVRARRVLGEVTEDATRAATHRVVAFGAGYVTSLALANEVLNSIHAPLGAYAVALASALSMDARQAWRARSSQSAWVSVREERRSYAWAIAVHRLRKHGIPVRAAGMATATLLNFVGPFAPVVLLVPPKLRARARKLLRLEEHNPTRQVPENDEQSLVELDLRRVARRRWTALAIAAGLSGALALVPSVLHDRIDAAPVELAFLEVDDAATAELRHLPELPPGFELSAESTRANESLFVLVKPIGDETSESTLERARKWAATQSPPRGTRFVWGPDAVVDPDSHEETLRGYRSYLVNDPPILTHEHIVDAVASVPDFEAGFVTISFDPTGAEAFASATTRLVGRRIAILVDGMVTSTPVVLSPIAGGQVTITMSRADGVEEAERLAASLRTAAHKPR